MSDSVASLQTARNQRSPVSGLPPEILSKIFMAYGRISFPGNMGQRFQWTNVTHVSQQWRAAGLNCPGLWSEIDCTVRSPWVSVMFERSKDVPLSLTLSGKTTISSDLEGIITTAMSQPGRLKRLSIDDPTDFLKKRLEELTRSHHLESLYLYGNSGMVLPDSLLSEGAPELKEVTLCRCTFSWASPIFTGLTTLVLHRLPKATLPSPQDETAFIDALERMPNLETLDLDASVTAFGIGKVPRVVPMARMKELKMSGPMEGCAGALQHMALPESAVLELGIVGDCDEDSTCKDFASTLTSSWLSAPLSSTNGSSLDILSLRIGESCGIRGWLTEIVLSDHETPPSLSIVFHEHEDEFGSLTPPSKLVSNFPLAKLRALEVERHLDEAALLTLHRLPSVNFIVVNSFSPEVMHFFMNHLDFGSSGYYQERIRLSAAFIRAGELLWAAKRG